MKSHKILKNLPFMTWKIPSILCLALPLCTALGQPVGVTDERLSEEKLAEYLNKIGLKQFSEVFQDFKDTSPHGDDTKAEYLFDLGKLLIRVSESVRIKGDKANAFDFAKHGVSELKVWMDGKASGLASEDRLKAQALMGKTMERLLKDGAQAIGFYEAAVKELASSDWKFESVEQLEQLKERVSSGSTGLSKEGSHAFERLIFLKREERIMSERLAAAAALRQRRTQASGN